MRTLAVDATTVEVLCAFEDTGCRSILLKGPTLQRELHRDGSRRNYGDTDLLVAPRDLPRAAQTLARLGFRLVLDHSEHPGVSEPHAQEWERAGRDSVDLHWRVPGVGIPAERAWDLLAARTAPIAIGRAVGESLAPAGVALLVALHAAHHGTTVERPIRDLERALDLVDGDVWAQAAGLARDLGASEAFAAGLRLAPAGERLTGDLGLPPVGSPRRRLLATDQPPGSLGVLRVLEAPTTRERIRALRSEMLPAPDFIRASSPLARRGRAGLALAYAGRLLARAWQLPVALRAVRWSRRPGRTPHGATLQRISRSSASSSWSRNASTSARQASVDTSNSSSSVAHNSPTDCGRSSSPQIRRPIRPMPK